MKKIVFIYNKFEEILLVASLAFTVSIIFYQVVMRYVFNDSPSWTEEVARYIFIWQIWLGGSVALKDGKHIRVELIGNAFVKKGKPIIKNILEILILLVWLSFAIFLCVGGFQYVVEIAAKGALSPGMRIPLMYVYAAVPVSALVVSFRISGLLVTEIKKIAKGGTA